MRPPENQHAVPSVLTRARHVLAVVLLFAGISLGQGAEFQDPVPDTAADTLLTDTLKSTVIPGMGRLDITSDTSSLYYTKFLWTDSRSIQDLFRFKPGIFVRDLGRPGLPDQIIFGGIDGRGVSYLMDGRPLTDPVTGRLNPYNIPIEFIDHLEVRPFEQAFVEGTQGSAATVNIVSRQYNTSRPITKIRFVQGPYEHLLTDALFTQNITRPVNFLFAVQRHVSDNRFLNSSLDAWNVRSRIRYNVTDRLNISLADFYQQSGLGMNNGINIDSTLSIGLDPFNEAEAAPFSESASESQTRRDVTLSVIALALDDSLSPTRLSVYFTTSERHYTDPAGLTSGLFDNYAFEVHGLSLRQTLQAGRATLYAGGQVERRLAGLGQVGAFDRLMQAWYADASVDLVFIRPGAMVRGERNGSGQGFSWGIHTKLTPTDGITLSGGWSDSRRFPTLQELNWSLYSFAGNPNLVERHGLAHVSVDVRTPLISLSADASQRTVENAIVFRTISPLPDFPAIVAHSISSLVIRQLSGGVTVNHRQWEATGGMTWTEVKEGDVITAAHPRFILTGELAYRDVFFDDALEARFSLQSRFVSEHTGTRFFPSSGMFAENTGKRLESFSAIDLSGVFHVGDAFLSITWENPLDRQFYTVFPYPAMGRNVKVGINWIFLD